MKYEDVKKAKKGDKEAFIRLIKQVEESMYCVAKAIVKSDEDCADVLQESIIKAYKSIPSLKEPSFFKTWLIRIVVNESKQLLRKKTNITNTVDISLHTHHIMHHSAHKEFEAIEIIEAIEALDDDLKQIVSLFYLEDRSLKETADALHSPEGTIKTKLRKARQKLIKLLGVSDERMI